jgi:hypothetical protein
MSTFLEKFVFPELMPFDGFTGYQFSQPTHDLKNETGKIYYVQEHGVRVIDQLELSKIDDPWNAYAAERVDPFAELWTLLENCKKNNISFQHDFVMDDRKVMNFGSAMSWPDVSPTEIMGKLMQRSENTNKWEAWVNDLPAMQATYTQYSIINKKHVDAMVYKIQQYYTEDKNARKTYIDHLKAAFPDYFVYFPLATTPAAFYYLMSEYQEKEKISDSDLFKQLVNLENIAGFDVWNEETSHLSLARYPDLVASFIVNGTNMYEAIEYPFYQTLHTFMDSQFDISYLDTILGMVRPGTHVHNALFGQRDAGALVVSINNYTATLQYNAKSETYGEFPAFLLLPINPSLSLDELAAGSKPEDFQTPEEPTVEFLQPFTLFDGSQHIAVTEKKINGYQFYGSLDDVLVGKRWIPAWWCTPDDYYEIPKPVFSKKIIPTENGKLTAISPFWIGGAVLALFYVANNYQLS